jgi:glycyl-tRNA synthetase
MDTQSELSDKIVSLCKRRSIIFQNSEIYGGINGFWDYGVYGVTIKRLLESVWWKDMVESRDDIVGMDSSIINNTKVWEASGHLDKFNDLMFDCKICKSRFKVNEDKCENLSCPSCSSKDLIGPRKFNLMMSTSIGSLDKIDDDISRDRLVYLRSETCQSIFANFDIIRKTSRKSIPFGIAQIGKAFRNEINPRNFIFRSREFTQMEIEYFCDSKDAKKWYDFWINERINFYKNKLNFNDNILRINEKNEYDLPHYSINSCDIEFLFHFGWGELESINNRGTWDLSRHCEFSNGKLNCSDVLNGKKYIPTVIETSAGVDRTILSIILHAYKEETVIENDTEITRVVLKLPLCVVPIQFAILPLHKKLHEISENMYKNMKNKFRVDYDDSGSIGRRYRRQDEIGTPYCVTIDFDTIENNTVTVRDRDSMLQERILINNLSNYFENKFIIL